MPHDELALWRAVRGELPDGELTTFRTTGRLSVASAIAIYRNAYWARQHEVLRELFPRVAAALGAARFRELVQSYLLACPSTHPELEHLGRRLPGFLRAQHADELVAVASTAAYEQALVESFLAPDGTCALPAEIVPETFALVRLSFVPSLRVVAVDGALLRVLASEGKQVVGAAAAVIARPQYAVVTHLAGAAELALLRLAREGATIGELLGACAHDISGAHVYLDRWFRRRWISALAME